MSRIKELEEKLIEKGERVSKATQVRSLIQKQKSFLKARQSLTDFKEPVLFLARRDGSLEIYEKATAGKFVFEHSTGSSRFIELRPSDLMTFPYADKKVRAYIANEDRPFAGWDEPIVDSETVMLGYEKTKATDLKYQERIENLKNKGKMTWVWIVLGIAGAIAIIGFAAQAWIIPALNQKAKVDAQLAREGANALATMIGIRVAKFKYKRNKEKVKNGKEK